MRPEEKIARTARRRPSNEASLIWSLLGALLFLVFMFNDPDTTPIPFTLHPMAWYVVKAAALAGVIALVWYFVAREEISKARLMMNGIQKIKRETARDAHLETTRNRSKDK